MFGMWLTSSSSSHPPNSCMFLVPKNMNLGCGFTCNSIHRCLYGIACRAYNRVENILCCTWDSTKLALLSILLIEIMLLFSYSPRRWSVQEKSFSALKLTFITWLPVPDTCVWHHSLFTTFHSSSKAWINYALDWSSPTTCKIDTWRDKEVGCTFWYDHGHFLMGRRNCPSRCLIET